MTGRKVIALPVVFLSVAVVLTCLALVQGPLVAKGGSRTATYTVRPGEAANDLEVTLEFQTLVENETVMLQKVSRGNDPAILPAPRLSPTYDVSVPEGSPVSIRTPENPDEGWALSVPESGSYSISYRVHFSALESPETAQEPFDMAGFTGTVITPTLACFDSSDLLMAINNTDGSELDQEMRLRIDPPAGAQVIADFRSIKDSPGFFDCTGGAGRIAWGDFTALSRKVAGTELRLYFENGLLDGRGKPAVSALADYIYNAFDEIADSLGRLSTGRTLTVIIGTTSPSGPDAPTHSTFRESMVIFLEPGKELTAANAAAIYSAVFENWNRWEIAPEDGSAASWFQAGLSCIYPLRAASRSGALDPQEAYSIYSGLYKGYLSDQSSAGMTLAEAELQEEPPLAFLYGKGAALCATMAMKLESDSTGGPVRNMDQLFRNLYQGLLERKGDRLYTLADVSTLLEDATHSSWDRFFEENVRGTGHILASEFSDSDLFGKRSSFGLPLIAEKGSGKSLLFLLGSAVLVMLIPVLFSGYVARAVDMDLSMPTIILDDEDR